MHAGPDSIAKTGRTSNFESASPSFDVKLTAPILSAGSYRVFVERSDLIFIQVEGGKSQIVAAFAPLLGPAGGLIPLALWLLGKRSARLNRERIETENPEDLLSESTANFKLHVAEIREASVEPPKMFMKTGKAGELNFSIRYDERVKCEFENAAQMTKAIQLLAPLLHSTLRVNVVWNEKTGKFEKKKEQSRPL
jgi:hypothetical protein